MQVSVKRCKAPDCTGKHHARGFCSKHYWALRGKAEGFPSQQVRCNWPPYSYERYKAFAESPEGRETLRRNYRRQGYLRNRRRKQATPKWLTDEQKQQILDAYTFRPRGYHVDHIIPLRGEGVCGLHVPWNLQWITAEENLKKGNKV